jgi:glycosyltransferase involved in cell wall biosynthesis
MRVVVSTWNLRRVAGIESYLATVIPELIRAGCAVAMLGEVDLPTNAARIAPVQVSTWCVGELGRDRAISSLREWRPEVVFANGATALGTQRLALEIAPAVFYAHGYYGICISGAKSFKFPTVRPCARLFGPACLLQYFPHRCGGLNPAKMWSMYRQGREQAAILRQHKKILAPSDYIRREYIRNGFNPEHVVELPYPFEQTMAVGNGGTRLPFTPDGRLRLLFTGRMTVLKGGALMLDATARVSRILGKPLHLTLAGDGPERAKLEHRARQIQARHPQVTIEFTGWLGRDQLDLLLDNTDLLVVPSVWPEPSALVGPEAGLRGVPQAAFALGGNDQWLKDSINGYLARGDPPTALGLAEAIIKCLRDPQEHASLRRGAVEIASRFTVQRHLTALLGVFENAMTHFGADPAECPGRA